MADLVIRFLAPDDVIDLFTTHVGDRSDLKRADVLTAAVAAPQTTLFGEDVYGTLALKAAALLRGLAVGRPFARGNARLALLATVVFLQANGFALRPSAEQAFELLTRLAPEAPVDELARCVEMVSSAIPTTGPTPNGPYEGGTA